MDEITQDVSKSIINDYLSALQERSGDCSRTTDKMPSNYQSLGLISILFPNAKIINCQRHPLDNALSIFFQKFVSGNQFAFDLADIGFWYKEYERLMTHWREVLPSPIYEVHYSDMVQNPKESARSLIEFCELEWEDACLDFHKSKREIQTASAWEVRQPIYTSSLGRWKAYEAHLDSLKECLGWKE